MIYLDNHATTPCDTRVIKAMLPFFSCVYGNPASLENRAGRHARMAVDRARAKVAKLIGAGPHEIVFTSGATESNNLAILGLARAAGHGARNRIVTSCIEHKSVLEACRRLAYEGYEIIELPVNNKGRVCGESAVKAINERTLLVSIQAANNEIGTIQDIRGMSLLAHRYGAAFHCDGAQAIGRVPLDVRKCNVDFLSISAHKMYGPKGVGALYIRGGVQSRSLQPLLYGGSQEWGLRPGTLNVPAIVGFGEACSIAGNVIQYESARLRALRDRLEISLLDEFPWLRINGDINRRLPNNSSITFPSIEAKHIIGLSKGLALSTGSACSCSSRILSHVLRAIGLSPDDIRCTIRIGWGPFNSDDDPDKAAAIICEAIRSIRMRNTKYFRKNIKDVHVRADIYL